MNSFPTRYLLAWASLGLLFYNACSENISPDPSSQTSSPAGSSGSPNVGGSGASLAGSGGSGQAGNNEGGQPTAGQSSAGQAGAGGQPSAGQAGAGGQAIPVECPKELPGPNLIRIPTGELSAYCMDQTEVTQGQYKQFLVATNNVVAPMEGICANTTSHEPFVGEDYGICHPEDWTPEKTPNKAVVCISPCDAIAYCEWAGKHLCGKIGGGSVQVDADKWTQGDPTAKDILNDKNISQFYNACSQGGKTVFPYGNKQDKALCPVGPGGEDATKSSCHGNEAPYDAILNLGGNVAEWEWTDPLLVGDGYVVRGLNNWGGDNAQNGHCDVPVRMTAGVDVGFRCCFDPKLFRVETTDHSWS